MATKKALRPEAVEKLAVAEIIAKALRDNGYETLDGTHMELTAGTIIARSDKADVQVKLITPALKNNGRYPIESNEDTILKD